MNINTIVCGKILSGKVLYHIETSQLICSADQSVILCMMQVFEKSDFQTTYYVTDFCNIFPINSVYLCLNFSILLSHVFLKYCRDCRLKYIFMCFVFLCSFFYSPFKHKIVYNDVKLCHQIEVFTPEYLNGNNKLHKAFLSSQFTVLTISKLEQINNFFYRSVIIADIGLNSGPVCKHELLNTTEWDIFKTKSLYLMYLNINSLLLKIDELRHMARLSNAAVIGISQSKLDKSITNSEIL